MRIVHGADWHIGNARSRIDPETGLNARLMDFYRCARFTIEDGVKRGANLVLHAGDIFDSCRPSPTERRLALEAFAPALEQGIPVLAITGNHDCPRSPSERHALDTLRDVDGLTIVDRPTAMAYWRLRNGRPVVLPVDATADDGARLEFQIACLPWPNKQFLLADADNRKLEPGELNQLVREKMMDCLRGLATELVPDIPSVLLGHFSVDTAEAGGQGRLMMLGGEWTLNVHELVARPFWYFALGHIHKPQCVGGGRAYYCGSPEAVGFGEEGEDKVYNLVEILPDDPEGTSIEPIATPHRRFVTLGPELWQQADRISDVLDGRALAGTIVRVQLPAAANFDLTYLRELLDSAGAAEFQIETQRAEAVRRRAVEVTVETSMDDAIKAWLEQNPDLKPMLDELLAEARRQEADSGERGEVAA